MAAIMKFLILLALFNNQLHLSHGVDVGRAKAKISEDEMLKLARKRRDDDKLFSINSPRKNEADNADQASKEIIHVKLPANIGEQMAKGQRERTRLRDAILGFPASLDPYPSSSSSLPTSSSSSSASTTSSTTSYFDTFEDHPNSKISHPKQPRNWEELEDRDDVNDYLGTSTPRSVQNNNRNNEDVAKTRNPDPDARSTWAIAWEAHVYFSGTLFVLLAIYASANILRLHTFSRLFSRNYFVSLNLLLVVIGLLRPIWLFHDPYNENLTWPRPVAYLLVDTGLPCMTSSFAVLFYALLKATQIELVSPTFQSPKALAILCGLHFLLNIGVDVTIGLYFNLRYMVLILQGVFIVWSLLLSAGYFYIFSAMNKVAMRQQGDLIRSVYPKLILEGGTAYNEATGQMQPLSSDVLKKPPLARAVHLTLGVAVLGSLLGGVQLFAMIKMLGLIKQDMSPNQNEWAWYGYQVSMRILEVTLCTLLAIIATTPLRPSGADHNGLEASPGSLDQSGICCNRRHKRKRGICPCFGDSNPPREFEDEIYSEICSNNHSVRQVLGDHHLNNPYMGDTLALGTLNHLNQVQQVQQVHPMLAMGSSTLMMPYGHKRASAAASYASQSATLLRTSNHSYNGAFQINSGSQRTSSSGERVPLPMTSSTSSRATLDTQLYSNIRANASRPSSMLFNDSGFVRFRMGNEDPEVVAAIQQGNPVTSSDRKKGLRASQSFDEAVLQDEATNQPIYHTASDPEDPKAVNDIEPELEAIYEPPPSAVNKPKKQSLTTPSESDEPQYSIYGRAPSQCSSISATQSFDLRMYGRLPKASGIPHNANNATINVGTLRKNEEGREKLENPYYYYGSTRNQKKAKIQQKPRPLLPSQRAALEMQQRAPAFVANQLPGERPKSRQQDAITGLTSGLTPGQARPPSRPSSRQALLHQELQDLQEQQNFTRSRSLGGYYQQQQQQQPQPQQPPPVRNQAQTKLMAAGSMTPLSYAKWQHQNQNVGKKFNPLYDTPPTQRHPMQPRPQLNGLQMSEIRAVMGNASPLANHRLQPQRQLLTEPVLSPILTDNEISPLHRTGLGQAADYLTDPSDSDDADMFTSQATQGYSEGLADNELESEVSSMFGVEASSLVPDMPKNADIAHLSPLEYSAMLKLYRSSGGMTAGGGAKRHQPTQQHMKDTTPDSGVVADNNNSNSNSNQSTSSSSNQKQLSKVISNPEQASSQNSLLSSSCSTPEAAAPIWQERQTQSQGKDYSLLESGRGNPAETLFSSSASSEAGSEDALTDKPSFRWDGTPLVDKTKDSKLLKKVKSLDQPAAPKADKAPRPPKRESSMSRKREEIK